MTRLTIAILLCLSATADAGFHSQRKSQRIAYRPMRWTARAQAGYPFMSTVANTSRIAANLTSPLSWLFW